MTVFAGVTDMDPGTTVTYKGITSVTVNGYKAPIIGEKADTSDVTIAVEPEGSATMLQAKWQNVTYGSWMGSEEAFEEGITYLLEVIVVPEDGYLFLTSDDGNYAGKAVMTGTTCTIPWIGVDDVQSLAVTSAEVKATAAEKDQDPDPVKVAVTLDQETLTLEEGTTQTLVAAVTPETSDPKVTWESSDPSVATVTDGVVTAVKAGKATITAASGDAKATCEVTVTEKVSEPDVELVPIYRLYLKSTGEHLYTSDYHEYRTLYTQYNWRYEGVAWYAPTEGTAVYRLYQPGLQNHLYTTDKNEVKVLTDKYGWVADNNGEALYYSGGDVSIYRVYNKGLSGMHHLTTDANEYNTLPKYGWSQEGVKLNALQLGSPLPTTKYYGH